VPSQGAMYAIIKIDVQKLAIRDDLDFTRRLLDEENVFVLPGSAFGMPNVFRVVFCPPGIVLETASVRIAAFCRRHVRE
jgi:tyrosine aminotransferase